MSFTTFLSTFMQSAWIRTVPSIPPPLTLIVRHWFLPEKLTQTYWQTPQQSQFPPARSEFIRHPIPVYLLFAHLLRHCVKCRYMPSSGFIYTHTNTHWLIKIHSSSVLKYRIGLRVAAILSNARYNRENASAIAILSRLRFELKHEAIFAIIPDESG